MTDSLRPIVYGMLLMGFASVTLSTYVVIHVLITLSIKCFNICRAAARCSRSEREAQWCVLNNLLLRGDVSHVEFNFDTWDARSTFFQFRGLGFRFYWTYTQGIDTQFTRGNFDENVRSIFAGLNRLSPAHVRRFMRFLGHRLMHDKYVQQRYLVSVQGTSAEITRIEPRKVVEFKAPMNTVRRVA